MGILNPLYEAVAWVFKQIYNVLSPLLGAQSGWTWALTIVILVALMRLIMVPLFIKQMHTTRAMTSLAPQMSALRKKYKNDKQALNQEMMKLYQEAGVNPLMGCLPVVAQLPMFFALFSVLKAIAEWKPGQLPKYGLTTTMMESAQHAKIFGVTISDKFLFLAGVPLHAKAVILIAVLVSMTTTYLTVRQSMKRGMMPAATPDNPMGQSQKYMAYIMPLFALSGLYWPFGLVLYWVTTNLWTLGQQWLLFRKYPQPVAGGAAAAAPIAATVTTVPARKASRPPVTSNGSASGNGTKPAAGQGTGTGPASKAAPGTKAAPGAAAGSAASSSKAAPGAKTQAAKTGPGAKTGQRPAKASQDGTRSRLGQSAQVAPAAADNGGGNGNGSGMLRRFGRGRAEPAAEAAAPEVKLVRQQRQRQSRSKRSGKR